MSDPVQRTLTIAAPPERVLAVVTDFADYPNWQKEIVSTEIVKRDERDRPLRVRMLTAAMGMKANSEIELKYHDDGVGWSLVEGDMMTQNDSRYWLRPNDSGGTDVDLEMTLGLKWNLPDFMMTQIITKGINDNLKAVKRVAESG
jgi:uncharacterized membrane protein